MGPGKKKIPESALDTGMGQTPATKFVAALYHLTLPQFVWAWNLPALERGFGTLVGQENTNI